MSQWSLASYDTCSMNSERDTHTHTGNIMIDNYNHTHDIMLTDTIFIHANFG